MIILKNDFLTVKIAKKGAEIKSIVKNENEYMWGSDPAIWGKSAPILFPICGGLKDDKFIFEGKEYTLEKHGFASSKLFSIEQADDESATLLLKSDEQTKAVYPFDFEFRAKFTLSGEKLDITYSVKNIGTGKMYFSFGSHEAYATPEGIEDYDIIFPEKETLNASYLYGSQIGVGTYPIIKDSNVLPLYDKYFIIDALLFTDVKSKSATLRNRKTGRSITIDFPDKPYLLLWHKHLAPYICIEPWNGIPDYFDSDYDITKKPGITELDGGKTYESTHTLKF